MPPGPEKRDKNDVVASGSEGIDALPNEVLEHILGFLPATEAARTSVLAHRWRYLWKSATGLRVRCVVDPIVEWDEEDLVSFQARQGIVDEILRLHGSAPLDTFEVVFRNVHDARHMACMNRWVQHAITCQARTIRVQNIHGNIGWGAQQPLVSAYLTRLELAGVALHSSFVDFSDCPSLEHLDIVNCFFSIRKTATNLTSDSLKHLTIRKCFWNCTSIVRVPNLVSLRLDGHFHEPPVSDSMPMLQEAFVRIVQQEWENDDDECDLCSVHCYSCGRFDTHEDNKYGLLKCLSEAENLTLISGYEKFVFHKALFHCPTFSKLKTLLLNDSWCEGPNYLYAAACILKHSPVLQKLCLQFFSKEPKHKLIMKGRPNATELSTGISSNLKIVEVHCEVADERVSKVLKSLGTYGISFSSDDAELLE